MCGVISGVDADPGLMRSYFMAHSDMAKTEKMCYNLIPIEFNEVYKNDC